MRDKRIRCSALYSHAFERLYLNRGKPPSLVLSGIDSAYAMDERDRREPGTEDPTAGGRNIVLGTLEHRPRRREGERKGNSNICSAGLRKRG